ncbi:methyltransferase domain-containing protein [Synechococcus sp. BS56D]|uniref:class I SAM-dependent methyltransferase n=1 Tax=Synechococcus sp. BS56D TaxID=2055944 RepID=UPI001386EAAB
MKSLVNKYPLLSQLFHFPVHISKYVTRSEINSFLRDIVTIIPPTANLTTPLRILCVGSSGAITNYLRASYPSSEFVTLDLDVRRNPDILADITYYHSDSPYDVIFMMEVLEHIPRPHLAVQSCYALLKPCGYFVLSTPFLFPIHDKPYDYYRYTEYGLRYLLSEFNNVDIKPRSGFWGTIAILFARSYLNENMFACIIYIFTLLPMAALLFSLLRLIRLLSPLPLVSTSMSSGYNIISRK